MKQLDGVDDAGFKFEGDEKHMTGRTKYPIFDQAFLPKMIAACNDDEERGLVYILYYTGMHGSSLCELTSLNIVKEGDKQYLEWKRPKTKKQMKQLIPKDKWPLIMPFIQNKKRSLQWYNVLLKKIGARAGFGGISTMTFRHNRCIRALTEDGYQLWQVRHLMGCTLDVVERNYTKLTEDQLMKEL